MLVGPQAAVKHYLRMIAGLEEITEGNIYIGDRLVTKLRPRTEISLWCSELALTPHERLRQPGL